MSDTSQAISNSSAALNGYADRLIGLLDTADDIATHISDLKKEAESAGFDKKLLLDAVKLKRMDFEKRKAKLDQIELFDTYLVNLGLKVG